MVPAYACWARKQANYILGDTGRSFVVGYGVNPPGSYHHRGSSCFGPTAQCGFDLGFNSPKPNPNVLTGALVGGPGAQDGYVDSRENYMQAEVAVDFNAGFTGLLAFLSVSATPGADSDAACGF